MEAKRIVWLDQLRIFGIFSMMVVHVAVAFWFHEPVATYRFLVLNAYNELLRYCVPVVVMVSGVFMLDPARNVTLRSVLKKNLPRIFVSLVFWTLLYGAVRAVWRMAAEGFTAQVFFSYVFDFIGPKAHLWFLYMIAGLYLATPLLRVVTRDDRLMRYFLLLSVLFAFLLPTVRLIPGADRFLQPVTSIACDYVLGFTGYYVLGFYLYKREITARFEAAVYGLGLLGALMTAGGSALLSLRQNAPYYGFESFMTMNQLAVCAALFVFFKQRVSKWRILPRRERRILHVSEHSFAMYLVHALINEFFIAVGFNSRLFNALFSVPVIAVIVFLLSYAAAVALRRIPFARKYLS